MHGVKKRTVTAGVRRWRYVFVGIETREGVSCAVFAQLGPRPGVVRYVCMSRLVMIRRMRKASRSGENGRAAQIGIGLAALDTADGREGPDRAQVIGR